MHMMRSCAMFIFNGVLHHAARVGLTENNWLIELSCMSELLLIASLAVAKFMPLLHRHSRATATRKSSILFLTLQREQESPDSGVLG